MVSSSSLSLVINHMIYMSNIKCRSLRMLKLMVEGARLKMLMAWCSTLGGAHSSLGEHNISHVSLHHKITIDIQYLMHVYSPPPLSLLTHTYFFIISVSFQHVY